jgi:integrase
VDNRRSNAVTVSRIVKRAAQRLGKDSTDYSGHSLRRGFAIEAASNGAPIHAIMKQGGWKSIQVVQGYMDQANITEGNGVEFLGL